ncbi:19935_t:CDS:2, partial [Cetraspora pellucida]
MPLCEDNNKAFTSTSSGSQLKKIKKDGSSFNEKELSHFEVEFSESKLHDMINLASINSYIKVEEKIDK